MRFIGRAISGGVALLATVAALWFGFRPYIGCAPGLDGVLGAYCATESESGGRRYGRGRGAPGGETVFSVELQPLRKTTENPILTAFGAVQSGRSWEIRAEAGGRLVELAERMRDGATVRKDQLLMRIDPADPATAQADAAAALAEAEAEQADARRSLALAQTEKKAAEAQRKLRARLFERQKALVARGVSAETARDEAELALAEAERAVITLDQAVATAERRVTQSAAQVERAKLTLSQARRNVGETEIRAPFDGTLRIDTEMESGAGLTLGRLVQVNDMFGALIDLKAMEVWFRVSDVDFARLLDAEGRLARLPATAVLELGERQVSVPARLKRVSATVSPEEGGRRVYAALEVGPETVLRPGDFVRVAVQEPPLSDVANLPASALDEQERILVVDDQERLRAVETQVLRRFGDRVLLRAKTGALPWGARVVSVRTPRLAPGVKVKPAVIDAPAGPGGGAVGGGGGLRAGAPSGARVALAPDRRARLIAFVKAADRMPPRRRARLLEALDEPEPPLALVERLERRMTGAGRR